MLKAIVFDFDGVIVDSEPLHFRAMLEVGRRFGARFDFDEYLRAYVGFDDRDGLRAILRDAGRGDLAGDDALVMELVQEKGRVFEGIVDEGVETIGGAVELIGEASRQLPIAVASGATTSDIELILGKLGLRDRFKVVVAADHVARSKPDPQTYRLACRRLMDLHEGLVLEGGECLAIEDTTAGIASARAAGLQVLALKTSSPADALSKAHRVVDDLRGVTLAKLREWFD